MSQVPAEVVIQEFSPAYAKDFARLNYHWIETCFSIEPKDREILDHPESAIIDAGGHILFAICRGEVVGTVALMPVGDGVYELTKMAVAPGFRGHKIGKRLMLRALDVAIRSHQQRVVILSNTRLVRAIKLYLQFGFQPIDLSAEDGYERANIKLEKVL